ncbi:hypothetical protein [Thiolinea disciformis]|uniref:hypothetical protein n=1 Tax=Thiolinea disciformis TaxID=125614 RepID=UPI000375FB59|nr:hypothetical protein [Thiolinea disciformis]
MSEVIEYLFFTRPMADRFADQLKARRLDYAEVAESVQEAIVFQLHENLDEDTWDELDELYDELSAQDQALLESGMIDETAASAAGLYLQLADGRQTIAKVNPELVNRILTVLSLDELNQFLEVIVSSVENPDDSAICQTH